MKLAILLIAAAIVSANAQPANMKQAAVNAKPAATGAATEKAAVSLDSLKTLEKEMDARLSATGGADPCVIQAYSRGLFVNGVGAVFTAEVGLVATPGGTALFPGAAVGPDQKAKIRKSELAHVPMLQQTLRDMVLSLANSPFLKMGDNDQIVVAVRLWYQRWEDTAGMPGQMIARLDHKGGTVKMEVQ